MTIVRSVKVMAATKVVERFDFARFLPIISADVSRAFDSCRTPFFEQLRALPAIGTYMVGADEIARADLISYRLYRSRDLWWILCYYNGVLDPMRLDVGLVLQYPSLASLDRLFFSIQTQRIMLSHQEVTREYKPLSLGAQAYYLFTHDERTFIRRTSNGRAASVVLRGVEVAVFDDEGAWHIKGDYAQVATSYFMSDHSRAGIWPEAPLTDDFNKVTTVVGQTTATTSVYIGLTAQVLPTTLMVVVDTTPAIRGTDNGYGQIQGRNMSGTIDYATGDLTISLTKPSSWPAATDFPGVVDIYTFAVPGRSDLADVSVEQIYTEPVVFVSGTGLYFNYRVPVSEVDAAWATYYPIHDQLSIPYFQAVCLLDLSGNLFFAGDLLAPGTLTNSKVHDGIIATAGFLDINTGGDSNICEIRKTAGVFELVMMTNFNTSSDLDEGVIT